MKINAKVFNGLVVGVFVVGAVAGLGLAFGFVPTSNQEFVTRFVGGLIGAFTGLFVQKGE